MFIVLCTYFSFFNTGGVGAFTKSTSLPAVSSYSICGILEIPADQKMSLYIYLTTQEQYTILEGSRVSMATTQPVYQAFHVTLSNSVSILLDFGRLSGPEYCF